MAKKGAEEKIAEAAPSARPTTSKLVGVCVMAWLIPGVGHWLLGRRARGLILFVAIGAMFVLGLAMKGEFFASHSGSLLAFLGHYGELSVGLPMFIARFFGYAGQPLFVSSDYGTAYLVTAGMLNLLCILDAYDIALGRKN